MDGRSLNVCTLAKDEKPTASYELTILLEKKKGTGKFFKLTDTFGNFTILHETQSVMNDEGEYNNVRNLIDGDFVVSQMIFYEGMVVANPIKSIVEIEPLTHYYTMHFLDGRTSLFQGLILVAT